MRAAKGLMFSFSLLLLLLMGLLVLIKTLPPPFWEGPIGQTLILFGLHYDEADESWIYKYQTAITGVFAIMAAVVTVLATLQIDGRAAKRHRQLIYLSLRPEALKVDRMLKPHFDDYCRRVALICHEKYSSAEDVLAGGDIAMEGLGHLIERSDAALATLRQEPWVDGKNLMAGELTASYGLICAILVRLEGHASQVRQYRSSLVAASAQANASLLQAYSEAIVGNWNSALDGVASLKDATAKFESDVNQLRKLYDDVSLDRPTEAPV